MDLAALEIEGVFLHALKVIPAQGGPVLHFLRKDSPIFKTLGFFPPGEIYFSEIEPCAIKAWKRHKLQNQLFAVPWGAIKIVLYDGRPKAQSYKTLLELKLGRPDNYALLRIPSGIWYGFRSLNGESALICNYADRAHDPEEAERLPPDSSLIPYSWL